MMSYITHKPKQGEKGCSKLHLEEKIRLGQENIYHNY